MTDTTDTTVSHFESFDLAGPLPTGVTLLQASAGTGKTFALAALAVRSIAESGLRAFELCVVTFTEAATSELRGRIRERIVEAISHLRDGCPATTDVVLDVLGRDGTGAAIADAERELRLQRLRVALDDFDTATISTIHGFCSRVLAMAGDAASDAPIASDSEQINELVNDVFVARYSTGTPPPASQNTIVTAVTHRLKLPDARLYRWSAPDPGPDPKKASDLTNFRKSQQVDAVVDLVDELVEIALRRRREQTRRTYDSLITDARAHIVGPDGVGTIATLRKRFALVMIDEFQDTDHTQWSMFRTAFLDGDTPVTTVLVGDPKQSIYRFRSAELSAYLGALQFARANGRVFSLRVNWRSDKAVLDGLDHMFTAMEFGAPEIRFESVEPAPDHLESPFEYAGVTGSANAAVEIRTMGEASADDARRLAFADLVTETIRLLNEATIERDGARTPLKPSDIGVLVRSNRDASRIAEALNAAGVPTASSSNDSVLSTPAAGQWRRLLEALERPASIGAARAAATTWFLGLDASALAGLSDDALSALLEQVRSWSSSLLEGGLPRLMARLRAAGLAQRVLASPSGERDLTDLEHVAELLQRATSGRSTTAASLRIVLDELGAPDADDMASELLGRRIDRDDDTVKVLTIHKAKGLEFPVVLCPVLWGDVSRQSGAMRHGEINGQQFIDISSLVTGSAPPAAYKDIDQFDKEENEGEHLRLLYVALTRARHRLVVWWKPAGKGAPPLARLFANALGTTPKTVDIDDLVELAQGTIAAVAADDAPAPVRRTQSETRRSLGVATITRELQDNWRVWSFTSMKAAAEAQLTTDQEAPPTIGGIDEFASDDPESLDGNAPASPLQSAPAGAAFGTLVHSALEQVDFTSTTLGDQLTEACASIALHRPRRMGPEALADALIHALQSPLGGPLGHQRLIDLAPSDRLNELDFDLPLGSFDARLIAEVMLQHLPETDPLHRWFVEAAYGGLEVPLEGMLTGSIDLVARTTIDGQPCFWLADYKTNLIRTGDYSGSSLAEAMHHSGYPLQATIYLVALHRYLRWRLADSYDPSVHLLGGVYLFLRGMNPDNALPDAAGAHWFRPPIAAIEAIDALFATGVAP